MPPIASSEFKQTDWPRTVRCRTYGCGSVLVFRTATVV